MTYRWKATEPVTFVCFDCQYESKHSGEVHKIRMDELPSELRRSQLCQITIVDKDEPFYDPMRKTIYTQTPLSVPTQTLEKFANLFSPPSPSFTAVCGGRNRPPPIRDPIEIKCFEFDFW